MLSDRMAQDLTVKRVFEMLAYGLQCIMGGCNHTDRHYERLASRPGAAPGGSISTMRPAVFSAEEVLVEPTALNTPPPLLRWFYQQTKKPHSHPVDQSIYNVMLFTDGCAVYSENQ